MSKFPRQNSAFTLIELSIVLVIIGLIIGGVLVGRDLISAAAVRAQLSQIEKYNTAVNTFYGKYDYLPGDIPAALASSFGMVARLGVPGHGDGDGIINDTYGYAGPTRLNYTYGYLGGEDALFWNDLAFTQLIEGDFSLDTDSAVGGVLSVDLHHIEYYLPQAKIGGRNYIAIFSFSGGKAPYDTTDPCYRGNFCFSLVALDGVYAGFAGVTPAQALAMDTKIDDGLPLVGNVRGNDPEIIMEGIYLDADRFDTFYPPAAGNCLQANGTGWAYDLGTAGKSNVPLCIMNFTHK